MLTENAFGYNRGKHIQITQAISQGFMGRCAMIWKTAGTNRVCSRCLGLKDTIVGYTDESGVTLPPLHPRCRCSIAYDEVGGKISPLAPPPRTPPLRGGETLSVDLPGGVGLCKTFDEAKIYWADNYNVAVAQEIKALHFESVRAAMSGVEAVIKEFPQTGFYLKEFGVNESGLMNVSDGYSKINFNAEYFAGGEKLLVILAAGARANYYPQNMSIFGAGVHEAAHVLEKLLAFQAERIIVSAYGAVIRSTGKFQTLKELRKEIAHHATESFPECLADALADYKINGNAAAKLSQAVWQELKKELAQNDSL